MFILWHGCNVRDSALHTLQSDVSCVVVTCQPLMDNLESHTYEVFEKDPVKYSEYQKAIFCALRDRVSESEAATRVTCVVVDFNLIV